MPGTIIKKDRNYMQPVGWSWIGLGLDYLIDPDCLIGLDYLIGRDYLIGLIDQDCAL